jgi:hypothetical protein
MWLAKQSSKQAPCADTLLQWRSHLDFVLPLRDLLPCRSTLLDQLCDSLELGGFTLQASASMPL